MLVHIYGHPVDMDPILELAERNRLAVIEDAAEGHGAEYLVGRDNREPVWRRCGSFGTLSCFSFYANKLITTGEGGMILTDRAEVAEKARSLQSGRRFYHEELGFNFRITNLQAALGRSQLERVEQIVSKKRWTGWEYTRRLARLPGLQLPVEEAWARSVYWMYGVVVSEGTGMNAETMVRQLAEHGIETRPFFLGMHEQPVFRRRGWFLNESYPIAERLARQGLYLPSGIALTEEQLGHVVKTLQAILD